MRPRLHPAAPLALALLPVLAGCAAVVAGGAAALGYVYYSENEAFQDFEADLEDTWDATLAALQSQNYPVSSSAPLGPTEGEIDVEDVRVRVERHPEGFTRVHVRVGTFKTDDHLRRARLLLQAVEERLSA